MTTDDKTLTEQIARAIAARVHARGEDAWRDYRAYATAVLPVLRDLAESLAALAPEIRKVQHAAWVQGAATLDESGYYSLAQLEAFSPYCATEIEEAP